MECIAKIFRRRGDKRCDGPSDPRTELGRATPAVQRSCPAYKQGLPTAVNPSEVVAENTRQRPPVRRVMLHRFYLIPQKCWMLKHDWAQDMQCEWADFIRDVVVVGSQLGTGEHIFHRHGMIGGVLWQRSGRETSPPSGLLAIRRGHRKVSITTQYIYFLNPQSYRTEKPSPTAFRPVKGYTISHALHSVSYRKPFGFRQ